MFRISVLALALSLLSTSSQASFRTLIVGGEEAAKDEIPFIVSLQDSGGHFCGGSLVAEDWILTAAHCVVGGGPTSIYVGLHDREDTSGAEVFRPSATISHPKYNSETMDYDYALIRLDGASKFKPVALNAEELSGAAELTTAGWGLTQERGDLADKLQKVNVPLVSSERCNNSYRGEITERMVCAGFDIGGKDSCQGDSGGPLYLTSNGTQTLVGIVSWGEGCARANKYGVYAKVSSVTSWISEKTN